MTIVAIPLQYLIYERPQFFVLGLLALNSAGSIITTEHVYVNYQHTAHFDTPALRAGKSMVSLGVALAIVITFQLFVLRRPARSRLRKQMGKLVYANLAYNTILQAYVRAVLPADSKYRCKPSVLKRVERELKHRESKMQNQILELSPLIAFVVYFTSVLLCSFLFYSLDMLLPNQPSESRSEAILRKLSSKPTKSSWTDYEKDVQRLAICRSNPSFWRTWSQFCRPTDVAAIASTKWAFTNVR